MPPRVIVVDHHDSYTWNLVHLIALVTGRLPDVVQHDATTPEHVLSFDHVVLSPGPGHPANEADFSLGTTVLRDGDRPVLGVCLGMQGLVTAYGGRVERARPAHGEVAAIEHDGRGVFAHLAQGFAAVRYHSLQATELPDCLVVTATCPGDDGAEARPIMGVRHTAKPLEGVQFHPESILSEHGEQMIRNFLS